MPADYYDKQERRRARLERAADLTEKASRAAMDTAHRMGEGIPLGQPILIGHHSERRDRNYRERINRRWEKGAELAKKAAEYRARIYSIGNGGISSDAPDAVDLLGDKVRTLEAQRDKMKRRNLAFRKGGWAAVVALEPCKDPAAAVAALEALAAKDPWFCGVPHRPYELTNLGARIREAKRRAAVITVEAARPSSEDIDGGWTTTEDADENRIQVRPSRRLTKEEYRKVRGYGFVWCPTTGAFQRKRSNGARYAAGRIVVEIPIPAEPATAAPEAAPLAEEVTAPVE